MRTQLLVVVYYYDLPQFELMLYCLSKNWQGNKKIKIVFQGEIYSQILSIIEKTISSDWDVEILPSSTLSISGNDLQQFDKVINSLDDEFDDIIVVDCKDFLLKPIDESYFKKKFKYRITKTDSIFSKFYPTVFSLMGDSFRVIPAILNITPWMWNVNQLRKYWNYCLGKFGTDTSQWSKFYPESEIASYYYFTAALDSTSEIEFDTDLFMPSGGIWDNNQLYDTLQVVDNFDKYESAFWKHHRRITDYSKTMITAMQLQKYNIPIQIIINWIQNKHNLRS